MAYGLPDHGETNYDTELNASLAYLKTTAETAGATATSAAAAAASAQASATTAANAASAAADTATTALGRVGEAQDATVARLFTDDTTDSYAAAAGLVSAVMGFRFYSPKQFPGCVIGGGTSALTAIQAAYDAAHENGGGCVVIDERYGFDGNLNIRGGVATLQTANPQLAVPEINEIGLVALSSSAQVTYGQGGAGGSVNDNPGTLINLYIDGNDVGGATEGLFVCDASNATLINLHVRRSAGVGVNIGSSQNLIFYNLQCHESYTGEGVALLLQSRSIGRQGPGGNKFFGGHIGDSLVPLKVSANDATDFFPPHDNIFEGVIFETGRVAGKAVTCTGIFEAGETMLRSCVATIGANATSITADCNYRIDNPIFTGYSTTVTFDSCYFGAGAGSVKATDHVRVLQTSAFNEIRFKGRSQFANGQYVLCMDGTHLGAGSDLVGSLDHPVIYVTGGYAPFRGINSGGYTGILASALTPVRYAQPSGLGSPLQLRRDTDTVNRWQIDRDGTTRWLDGSGAGTIGSISRVSTTMALSGPWGFVHGYVRAYATQTISSSTTATIDMNLTNTQAFVFTGSYNLTSITINNAQEGQELRIVMVGSGTNVITWPGSVLPAEGATLPQPVNGVKTFLDLVYVGGSWQELSRSEAVVNQVRENRITTGHEAFPREFAVTTATGSTSQLLKLTYFTAYQSMTITKLASMTGGTAAGATPTLCRMGLYTVAANGDLTLVASTANDTTLWAAANTAYEKAISSPSSYTITKGTRYAFATLVVTAATAPSFVSSTIAVALVGESPRINGQKAAQSDLPSTVTAATVADGALRHYGELRP